MRAWKAESEVLSLGATLPTTPTGRWLRHTAASVPARKDIVLRKAVVPPRDLLVQGSGARVGQGILVRPTPGEGQGAADFF